MLLKQNCPLLSSGCALPDLGPSGTSFNRQPELSLIISCHQLLDSGMKYILDVKNGLGHFISSAPVLVDAVPLIASAMSFGTSVSHGVHEFGEEPCVQD